MTDRVFNTAGKKTLHSSLKLTYSKFTGMT